jgi:hypothetical protein
VTAAALLHLMEDLKLPWLAGEFATAGAATTLAVSLRDPGQTNPATRLAYLTLTTWTYIGLAPLLGDLTWRLL